MIENLVIVESPAKAKTIEKFLGNGYTVKSSFGHIRDLEKKDLGVDIEHNFQPKYEISSDKKTIVKELKTLAKEAKTVWLASDEDREGEAIAWHLFEVLKLKPENTKRIVFHEITKDAILHAIQNPRNIDKNLVDAQQARRVLDRLVGFEMSPVLWKKVKPSLSAGRVQSVAVKLIVEREREINAFKEQQYYRVCGTFETQQHAQLKAEVQTRFTDKETTLTYLEACKTAIFHVDSVETRPTTRKPAPPFTTSTLQQEASRKLGFSVSQTMSVAQKLYEHGLITYMRTDSVNLSDLAIRTAKAVICETLGEKYSKPRNFATKTKGAQEAHEAIRPTYMNKTAIEGDRNEQQLYELIYKRTLASQMADAQLERTNMIIGLSNHSIPFTATGEVIIFNGFLKVYMESHDEETDDEQAGLLPALAPGDQLQRQFITAIEQYTLHPPRYTEASLVKKMEALGIGRPSTYAPTIQTIQNREYVIKGDKEGVERIYSVITLAKDKIKEVDKKEIVGADRNKLMPTDIGTVVNDFLMAYFPDVLDYNFTASVEKEFDAVAEGEMVWTEAIDKFYKLFHPIVEETAAIKTEHKVGERQLGVDPKTGNPVFVKIGRYGPVVQIGQAHPDDKEAPKPQFATLMKGQSIETITLEEALKLFDLPRTIGEYEGKDMVAAVGRFGPFIRHDGKFISIPKDLNPLSITAEEAIELIDEKRKKDEQRYLKKFDEDPELEILNGRYGPYITYKKANYRIPKTVTQPEKLTYEECMKIITEAAEKPATPKKRTTKKKA